jgi:hypothetical protein
MRSPSLLACLALAIVLPFAHAAGLNDTGIQFCGDYPSGNSADCSVPGPAGQDRQYGRDAAAAAGTLTKVGGGEAGFDFTALDASGNPTTPSGGATPHPCVRDNVTGLIWEVKTDDGGLRDQDWTYTWYDSVHNYGGNAGTASGGTCLTSGRCDTEKYVADVNAAGLCGYSDWRMPTRMELQGIVYYGRELYPAIDSVYFPNTRNSYFWTGSVSQYSNAWFVEYSYGTVGLMAMESTFINVRLVRSGQ